MNCDQRPATEESNWLYCVECLRWHREAYYDEKTKYPDPGRFADTEDYEERMKELGLELAET